MAAEIKYVMTFNLLSKLKVAHLLQKLMLATIENEHGVY